jgi:hypothetical protein
MVALLVLIVVGGWWMEVVVVVAGEQTCVLDEFSVTEKVDGDFLVRDPRRQLESICLS